MNKYNFQFHVDQNTCWILKMLKTCDIFFFVIVLNMIVTNVIHWYHLVDKILIKSRLVEPMALEGNPMHCMINMKAPNKT